MPEEKKEKEGSSIKIETAEQLDEFANKTMLAIEEVRKGTQIDIDALKETIKTLTVAIKDKWKDEDTKERRDYEFGKLIVALYQASIHGSSTGRKYLINSGCVPNKAVGPEADWKAGEWSFAGRDPEEDKKAALGTVLRGDTTTGSYLIPQEYSTEVLRVAADVSAMMNRVRTMPMGVRKISFPSSATEVSFSWPTNEAKTKTEKNPTFGQVDLEAKTAAGWITITEEMDEDSLVPLGSYFATLFGEAWGTEFDKQCLAANADPFTGLLYASSVNDLSMDTGLVAFADLAGDDLINLISKLTTKNKRVGAVYIMHPTIADLVSKLKDANGDYLFKIMREAPPGTINGYPYVTSDAMPDTGDTAADTPFIAFGNPKYIIHGNRLGMEFKVFSETVRAVDYDQIFFRCRLRQAFVVGVPAAFARLSTAAS